jgi:hypothetical protein
VAAQSGLSGRGAERLDRPHSPGAEDGQLRRLRPGDLERHRPAAADRRPALHLREEEGPLRRPGRGRRHPDLRPAGGLPGDRHQRTRRAGAGGPLHGQVGRGQHLLAAQRRLRHLRRSTSSARVWA